jgi:hypothetical protein
LPWFATIAAVLLPGAAEAQTLTQQGYLDTGLTVYPQTAPNDSGQLIESSLLHWEPAVKWSDWRFNAGFDAQFDSHRMAERTPDVSYWDREAQCPAFDVSRTTVLAVAAARLTLASQSDRSNLFTHLG